MIVRAISDGDLTAHIEVIVRCESALFAIEEAIKVATLGDDRADLKLMSEDLRGIIRWHKDAAGLP